MKVVLCNLDRTATRADGHLGRQTINELPDAEVVRLLERFRALDPHENFQHDPEIVLESNRTKRIVRLSHERLCLYNPGRLLDPALVLSPEQVVQEMSYTVIGPRPESPLNPAGETRVYTRPAPPPSRRRPLHPLHRAAAAVAVATLAVLLLLRLPRAAADPGAGFEADDAPGDALGRLAGVYVTGTSPGDHGIAVTDSGDLKLFRFNRTGAPDLVRDQVTPGRVEGSRCLLPRRTRHPVFLAGRNTLVYGGETYQRVP